MDESLNRNCGMISLRCSSPAETKQGRCGWSLMKRLKVASSVMPSAR